MKRIHIVGHKNSGKTTLIVDLVSELTRHGFRVGTIKHTHHDHELDTPGKDSHRHREAGSAVVGILTQRMNAIFWPKPEGESNGQEAEDQYSHFGQMMNDCDIVLVEGDSRSNAPKIEVFRSELGRHPFAATDSTFTAVVSDDDLKAVEPTASVPLWKRSDVKAIAQNILKALEVKVTG